MSWSISQGVKDSHFKDLWDMNEGATYVPWSQFPKEYSDLIDGAVIDDETLPPSMKGTDLLLVILNTQYYIYVYFFNYW